MVVQPRGLLPEAIGPRAFRGCRECPAPGGMRGGKSDLAEANPAFAVFQDVEVLRAENGFSMFLDR